MIGFCQLALICWTKILVFMAVAVLCYGMLRGGEKKRGKDTGRGSPISSEGGRRLAAMLYYTGTHRHNQIN